MADATYQPKVYRSQGSTSFVVASGGSMEVESGGEHNIQAGGIMSVGGSTFIGSTGKISPIFGLGFPIEVVSSGEGSAHAKTLRAGTCIHILAASTAVEWIKMPTPSSGDVKFVYQSGAATTINLESTNGAGHVWTSTGGNRIVMGGEGAGALFVAVSSTRWALVSGQTSTGGLWSVTISTST